MAKINGQFVICDRCGTQTFRKSIGEGEADGGYTRWNDFEPLPDGWDLVAIPKGKVFLHGNAHNDYLFVCPKCHALWDTLINENFLRDTPYYLIEENTDGNS